MKIEQYKAEYNRVMEFLSAKINRELDYITFAEYSKYCNEGYSPHHIKKDLKMSFNEFKREIGAVIAKCGNKQLTAGLINPQIYCRRGEGGMISADDCIPGCNNACIGCENRQENNKGTINDLTPEEDWEQRTAGIHGGNYGKTIESTINYDGVW